MQGYKKLIAITASLLFLNGCSNSDPEALISEEDNTVELIFGEQEVSFTAEHYATMTQEALNLFHEELPVYRDDQEQLERWFIRYYIQKHEYNESWSTDEMILLASERSKYETQWRNYAEARYEITASEEAIEAQAEYNIELYESSTPASVQGMADGLNLTIEEFFKEFDKDHVERTVIWEQLFPILQQEYADEENKDTVSVARRYSEEVIHSIQSNGPDFHSIPFAE
ncbi:hypothetical protein SAMN04488053_10238 [Alkalicoccus daliensis]|uniref:Uncharacterized protein n=2 Tax=Alkalicoccus daliensis TaxID=745820 RepID=A0A1H0CC93_9BACI|nr:hypothetical protein SAMN04488053_10238 [Alkalicoccus daliensis]